MNQSILVGKTIPYCLDHYITIKHKINNIYSIVVRYVPNGIILDLNSIHKYIEIYDLNQDCHDIAKQIFDDLIYVSIPNFLLFKFIVNNNTSYIITFNHQNSLWNNKELLLLMRTDSLLKDTCN